jgi:hypothetical protein
MLGCLGRVVRTGLLFVELLRAEVSLSDTWSVTGKSGYILVQADMPLQTTIEINCVSGFWFFDAKNT